MEDAQIAESIEMGAGALFDQFRYSNGFTSKGNSELAEAALVIHVAAQLIRENHVVWPESPFRDTKRGRTKHLDLLIHLSPYGLEKPDILTFEAKAIAGNQTASKVKQILKDHKRICDWRLLDSSGQPIFFSIESPRSVRGVLAILLSENVNKMSEQSPMSFSQWWKNPDGDLSGVSSKDTEKLREILKSASLHDVKPSHIPVGNDRLSVAYAIFGCEGDNKPGAGTTMDDEREQQTAEHEAAHALVALRSGFVVNRVWLPPTGQRDGELHCEWESARASYANDRLLLTRAFALAYAGAVQNLQYDPRDISQILNDLPSDVEAIKYARQVAVNWGLAQSTSDTADMSSEGYLLAHSLVEKNQDLILLLADEIRDLRSMDREALEAWFVEQTIGEADDAV